MGSIETAVLASKRLEGLLERNFAAQGKGLHEKTDSVAHLLDAALVRVLKRIASQRNRAVHEEGFEIPEPDAFQADVERAAAALSGATGAAPIVSAQAGNLGQRLVALDREFRESEHENMRRNSSLSQAASGMICVAFCIVWIVFSLHAPIWVTLGGPSFCVLVFLVQRHQAQELERKSSAYNEYLDARSTLIHPTHVEPSKTQPRRSERWP